MPIRSSASESKFRDGARFEPISRPRLRGLIAASGTRTCFVDAPPRYGTTTMLREYATTGNAAYLALPGDASFARFTAILVQALAPRFPGIERTFAGAYARALEMPDPAGALAAWMLRHIDAQPCEIVIDDVHHAADRRIVRFIAEMIERSPESCRWLIASKSLEGFPIASWLRRGIIGSPIKGPDLVLTFEEALRLAKRVSKVDEANVRQLHRETAGVIGDFVALLHMSSGYPYQETRVLTAPELEEAGDIAGALDLLKGPYREREAFALIESDRSYVLHDAIANLSSEAQGKSPVVLTLKAIAASLAGRGDFSEAFFNSALERCTDEPQRRRVSFWYACDFLRRGRPEAIELLERLDPDLPVPLWLRLANQSALAAAYAFVARHDEAQALIGATLEAALELRDDSLTARVYHQAAFVALRACRYEEAKELARQGARLAEASGAFETAAGALSVLYSIAVDVDVDLGLAADVLRRIAECGAKCGSLEKQIYGLACAYEIEAERGDERALALIEEDLRVFDVGYASRSINEAALPGQALQLAWHGDFTRSYQILKASADQQSEIALRARRWAEIALYAAAAQSVGDATQAIGIALQRLQSTSKASANGRRAHIYLALAYVLIGHIPEARAELAGLDDEGLGSGRLGALVECIDSLIRWRTESPDSADVLARLECLHERGFGGFARMLEALPMALTVPEPPEITRGHSPSLSRLNGPKELLAARAEIAAMLCKKAPANRHTTILRLLAQSFVEEHLSALVEERPHAARAESLYTKPGRAAALEALCDAVVGLDQYLLNRGLPQRYLTQLPPLRDLVRPAATPQPDRSDYSDQLDEFEAQINELLEQFSGGDPKVLVHARAVSSWCARLARRLALLDNEVAFVARAGSLHHVGELTGLASEDSIEANPLLEPFLPVIREHCRILEDQESLAAKIVAVACAFNTFLVGDGERPSRTPEAALNEVLADCGIRYDVVVAAALHELVAGK